MELLCRVLEPVHYHDQHEEGELIHVELIDLEEMIINGVVQVIVNNAGENEQYDVVDPTEEPTVHKVYQVHELGSADDADLPF